VNINGLITEHVQRILTQIVVPAPRQPVLSLFSQASGLLTNCNRVVEVAEDRHMATTILYPHK
jgi:hypothetical protein